MQRTLHPRAAYNLVLFDTGELCDDALFKLYEHAKKLRIALLHQQTENTPQLIPRALLEETNDPRIGALLQLVDVTDVLVTNLQHYYKTTPEWQATGQIFGDDESNSPTIQLE